jgi:hypothetical protein
MPAAIRPATATIGIITAIAVFPPVERPLLCELEVPLLAPARPALLVDVDDDVPVELGAEKVSVEVCVMMMVLPA